MLGTGDSKGKLAGVDWNFNAWGGDRMNCHGSDTESAQAPRKAATGHAIKMVPWPAGYPSHTGTFAYGPHGAMYTMQLLAHAGAVRYKCPIVMEGGSFHVDGALAGLTYLLFGAE